ncbi:hypothetical protein BGZ76_008352 [Entomortierella beljakovae]|nr:hypothetical protein BGZ76_008352 [Entomortierella beljakovae]
MDEKVMEMKTQFKSYITQHMESASFTADCWTSIDQRKYFGLTLHFITKEFKLLSVLSPENTSCSEPAGKKNQAMQSWQPIHGLSK